MLCTIQQWGTGTLLLDPETMKYSQATDEGASEEPKWVPIRVPVNAGGPQLADHEFGFF